MKSLIESHKRCASSYFTLSRLVIDVQVTFYTLKNFVKPILLLGFLMPYGECWYTSGEWEVGISELGTIILQE